MNGSGERDFYPLGLDDWTDDELNDLKRYIDDIIYNRHFKEQHEQDQVDSDRRALYGPEDEQK